MGSRECDAFRVCDYTFSASSRVTYATGLLGLSVVIADAAMVERVVSVDACEAARARYSKAPARHRADAWGVARCTAPWPSWAKRRLQFGVAEEIMLAGGA